jgi:hypothetical protein
VTLPHDCTPVPQRLARMRELLADLDQFARGLWPEAPSYALSAPLTEAQLAAAEAELGVRLPAEYREFLLVVGTAGAGPDYGLVGPAGWAMGDELPRVTATVTTVEGATFTAGTGPRPALAGQPDPSRPFPLRGAWTSDDPLPVVPGGHLYDGCIQLNDIGCGYATFLVVTGEQRGNVWVDYSAGDGAIAPVGGFLDWYGRWLDEVVTSLLCPAIGSALDVGEPGPYERFVLRWAECFERRAATGEPSALADLAALRLYQAATDPSRAPQAYALIEQLDGESTVDDEVERLTAWADPAGVAAATGPSPDPAAVRRPLWRVRRLLAGNPRCPAEVLAVLAGDDRHEVRLAAVAHPSCPATALAALADAAQARWSASAPLPTLYELDLVARHPATPPSTVELLAALDERLADELASNVVRSVARRPDLPEPLAQKLSRSRWPWVRAAVAGNPATPAALAVALAADAHPTVRAAVAGRPDVPGALLAALADDPDAAVRESVAGNPAAPAPALRRLARDVDADTTVTYALAGNPAAPAEVLDVLRLHPYVSMPLEPVEEEAARPLAALVAEGAVADPDYPHALLGRAIADPDPMAGYRAGRSPWLDAPLLRQLAAHPYAYARLFACAHPATPADVLLALAADPVPMVVRRAAQRAEVPAEAAVRLAEHEEAECRWGAAVNPNLPVETLRRLAGDASVYVRRAVLANPNTPLSTVESLVRDPDLLVRRVAGSRDDLTEAMVTALLADPEPDVVASARWFLARQRLLA